MFDFLAKGLTKVFGTKSDRDIKEVLPLVEQINKEFAKLKDLSHDELRAKTADVLARINQYLKEIDDEIAALHTKVDENPDMDLHTKEDVFNEIDALEEKRNEKLEEVLLEVLPETFAIVKDTARRFMENEQLEVTASMFDKEMSGKAEHVNLKGDKAVWNNTWKAAGNDVTWDMMHYDVQLIGGIVLHKGKIAEMATGEGKTLVATLPAFLNALAKRGVHIVTVNDYLAKRDAEWMAPIFQFHGISVDCIDNFKPNSEERRKAYQSDIVYGTNNEFGFDYLRDNMTRETKELVQGKHHFAMIDEVDSVLIDEARTPLIISGPVPKGDVHEFDSLKPRIEKLVQEQRKLTSDFLLEAKKLIKEGKEDEGGLALFRAFRGLPKHKPLIKYLSEQGIRQILQKTENIYLADNSKLMPEADEPLLFTIEEKNNNIDLTEKGIDLITRDGEDPNFFILPDIGVEIANLEKDESYSDEEMLEKKDTLIKDYAEKAERIHSVNQLLKAYTLFEKDTEYILVDGKVKIVDEQTGRVMEGRRYSDGLHQAIEAKENVKVEDATQTYATITLQNYFRMYHKLAGMTGTAETEAGEFWDIYELDVVVIPTNKPIVRDDRQDKVYKTVREKFNAVAAEIEEMSKAGRPVLVGTTSVEISEILSRMLNMRKIKHQVLNAKQHAKEADVVAEAGKPGTVTIATNMAGRGTDIKLAKESKEAGGLAIIGTERHESRRVDRQLRGRAGRQGDTGSSQFFVSLEDNLMRMFGSDRIAKLMDRMGLEEGEVIQHSMISKSIERAQKKVEENNFGTRKRLLEYDDVMNSQREVIYKRRKNALYGERLQLDIMNMLFDTCEDIVNNSKAMDAFDDFRLSILGTFGIDFEISKEDYEAMKPNELTEKLYNHVYSSYKAKNDKIREKAFPILKDISKTKGATVKEIMVPFTDGKKQIGVVTDLQKNLDTEGQELILSMEKISTLAIIDENWKEHLREMDDLKQSVQNAVYEQKDPLLIYKFEGFELFKRFIGKLNEDTSSFMMKLDLPVQDSSQVQTAAQRKQQQNYKESKEESGSVLSGGQNKNRPPVEKQMPAKSEKVVGRNDRVSVQYQDGSVKKDVKFKTVEEDVKSNKCVLLDE
ncbi:protein translocase subunit SecA [Marivirga tractuosa]|uniref:Protein translocase subunit SecA n=1 Tax=Marivirga tractuosa (strain ATCC 23168 / DSM 4126 / NBRC 15989 / NCIMB 1408 / VKM B-1430 / H-43) TaxID=643867 RepID=E4TRM5_MARTH|nr:preprotein translocase subunit SecA [Marivirga tractuosa]ADR21746.1 protein translocase subunit secA [Marivirga tractuosa DSM 4126]BDD13796.1 protein translocase subunit SecA [Marivirga tractuosa]